MADDERKCCKRCQSRLFYTLMAAVYFVLLIISLVTLGTFGRTFADTTNFWRDHVDSGSSVCVLYGGDSDLPSTMNPSLDNNASCGFVFWGAVTIVVVFLAWMIMSVLCAIIGRPRVLSLFRIFDLIMTISIFILSLIISSVLTDGLNRTCNGFPESQQSVGCPERVFVATDDNEDPDTQSFFGGLDAAKDTSWTITVVSIGLFIFYLIVLFVTVCMRRRRNKQEKAKTHTDATQTDDGNTSALVHVAKDESDEKKAEESD